VVVTNGPQIDPGDSSGSWSAQQNVRDSERYEAVVHANSSFRASRISKECGPISDPQLHANCVASLASKRPQRCESRLTALLLSRSHFCVGTGAVMPEALAIRRSTSSARNP
jgi:hypothetical protein